VALGGKAGALRGVRGGRKYMAWSGAFDFFDFASDDIYNTTYDVVVIGGGVIGCHIAKQLSRYKINICLVEKENDVACRTSGANSGIVHAGYDAFPGSLKAKLNIRGNEIIEHIAEELDVPFKRTGSLVLAFDEYDMTMLKELYERGIKNGVTGMEILDEKQVREKEPAVSAKVVGALFAPTAGIICPYELTISAAEVAVENGTRLLLSHEVISIEKVYRDKERTLYQITIKHKEKGPKKIFAKYIINAAGVYANKISSMAGDTSFTITPRKGEYLLLDKNQGRIINSVVFQTPSKMGKGILITPTVDGNLLLGPTASDIEDKEDLSTDNEGLTKVRLGALKSIPGIGMENIITSFAGLRAVPSTGDFIIEESNYAPGFVNVAGIESPGLTAAPAIAEYVEDLMREAGLELLPKENYKPNRTPFKKFRNMSDSEINEAIKENSLFGKIVCRCEKVTAAEVVEAIRRPAGARTLDGVKRRTRAGMGRCQGGFCTPRVMEILSQELGIPMEEITKSGGKSWMLAGRSK